jgi:hypothetical protein
VNVPKIKQLYEGIVADIEAMFEDTLPLFGKVYLRAFSAVQAAKLKLFYLAIAEQKKNIFVDTATSEINGGTLERFGRIKIGRNPFPARAGQYTITVTGLTGSRIPASTTFKSNDQSLNPGKLFILDNEFVLTSSNESIRVRALDAGLNSKLSPGDVLFATAPILGVNKTAIAHTEIVEPLSPEDLEEYRAKTVEAFKLESQGGAPADYKLWALDAQGVARAYPYAKTGYVNEIDLFIEATPRDSEDGKGTPTKKIIDDVDSVVRHDPDTSKSIYERGRKPMQVFVHCLPVKIRQIDIEINGYRDITPGIQSLLLTAIKSEIDKIRPFVAAADVLENQNDVLNVNKIILVILTAKPGSMFNSITVRIDGVTENTYRFINGDIPFLNTVSYT